jgi:LCP family protein required for cell wall assembly
MRTTLKRGIGRGAAVNGNGRAVLPPGVLTPMRRYRVEPPRPPRTVRQLVGWAFKWLAIGLAVVVGGLAGGLYLYEHQTAASFAAHTPGVKKAQKQLSHEVPEPSQPAVALVVGYDKRKGADAALQDGSRSDTVMLVRADPALKAVSLLSFPRDLEVPIYCANGPRGVVDRINSAWSRCGPSGTVATVAALTHITPNYLITINFRGFKLLVNKLHGVYMDVDRRYINTQGGPYGYATINLHPGYQKLNGQQSLDFVRYRHADSDLYRLARQQLFVSALRDRLGSGSFLKVFKVVGALKGNLEIAHGGAGGGGALSTDTILSYLRFAHDLSSGRILRTKIENLTGFDTLTAPEASIVNAVDEFQHPDVRASEAANRAALGLKPKRTAPKLKPPQISTLVLNGTTVEGLATNTSYKLAVLGYRTVQLGGQQLANAPASASGFAATNVYFDPSQANAKLAAKQLQRLFKGSIVGPLPANILPLAQSSGNPLTVIVLGSTFDGELTRIATPQREVPKHQPPNVVASPGATLESLRAVAGRVPFRLMVPHVLERSSSLSQLEGVRVYKPAPHRKALRLTFVTGPGNVYWGIEQTNWASAPILEQPTASRTIKGRRFDFYYSGTHLHMIVLRTDRATYWVVNTLLDELSNETMIAIAKGLQPLRK